ncbi:peroxisomal membrane 22 kDa (Mpv17/PMP22) family protein [Medicago truncatula]|uniref:Peroxisomal membrane 22 kDa (Mpv17/PMP22) family protein n=1 Tax=Medicago truncatula TaxID=3880 RepID=A0A072VAN4_MEDTR|nr:peroxisomal membrane 22 kDa (Mpv17/PMP22) family protein [Medicago truncatula]
MAISGVVYSIGDWIAQECFLLARFMKCLSCTGRKLWPFANLNTYGVIPVEQGVLWVDYIELIWVTILST